jgi:hypothetical protein
VATVKPKDELAAHGMPSFQRLPDACVGIALSIASTCRSEREREILYRLVADPLMDGVWCELTKRNRTSGQYYHPARQSPQKPLLTQDDAQAQALRELFNLAYCSARDERSTSTLDQAMDRRRKMINLATILRECAEMRRQDLLGDPQAADDAAAVDRVAEWFEGISKDTRSIADPLSVQRQRGDPTVNGVAVDIGNWLSDRFGKRLAGIAATLASVALGKPASPRAVRSALTGTK